MQNETVQTIALYTAQIPGAKDSINQESVESQDDTGRFVVDVSQPRLTAYWPSKDLHNGCAVVICPGGGYRGLSVDMEGHAIAKRCITLGISAFVLTYRMPSDKTMDTPQLGPLQDLQQALHVVNSGAKNWHLDPLKIGVMGFSAGGHLASSAAVHYQRPVLPTIDATSLKPAFQILIYPVISMDPKITHLGSRRLLLGENANLVDVEYFSNETQVNKHSPPAFILHANDDSHVSVENSLSYYRSLRNAQVQVQLLLLPCGGHGFGLYHEYNWFDSLKMWLRLNQLIR